MAARKKTQAQPPAGVTLRSYNVGFGDCFLLSFEYETFKRHVLIDFGSTRPPPGVDQGKNLLAVAKAIAADCEGKLHAIVATHRHKDHISGFAYGNGEGPGAIIRELNPDLVIQPWTEDHAARRNAKGPPKPPRGGGRQLAATYLQSLHDMNAFAGYVKNVGERLKANHLKPVAEQLRFLGDDNDVPNRDAVENLAEMGQGRQRHVYFGASSGLETLLPGVTTHVLGPPTLRQDESIRRQRQDIPNQYWLSLAAKAEFWAKRGQIARFDKGRPAPLFPRYVDKEHPWDTGWYRYHAQREQAETLLSLVRILDAQMNNTSVILLFEIGEKFLLFPGDAQYENWQYALSHPDVVQRLSKVGLYKVGHHGSRNATPKDLWNGFAAKGGKRTAGRLVTLLSTLDHVHGNECRKTEVPRNTLLNALREESELHDTRATPSRSLSIATHFPL